jgi:hypothetical protein
MSLPVDTDDRLARLAATDEFIDGARIVARASDGRGAILRGLVGAIDETMLPASLVFASDGEGRLELVAGGRRLRGVVGASGGILVGSLADAPLEADETDTMDAVMALLVAFAERASGPVTVSETRAEEEGGRGLSARRLAELIPESDATPTQAAATVLRSDVDRFHELGGGALTACLVQSADGTARMLGDPQLQETLEGFASLAPDEPVPSLALWVRQTGRPDGRAFGRAAWEDGSFAIIAFPANVAGRIVTAFRASRAD